jgi:hypothetical protein
MTEQQWVRAERALPPKHIQYAHQHGRGMLTFEQIDELVKAINEAYVERKQNRAYLAQHQARAEMNRIFGYGNWDSDVAEMTLIYEDQRPGSGQNSGKMYWFTCYRSKVIVNIRDLWGMPIATFGEYHAEENAPQPERGEAHALAVTSVESYALRRALIGLGDRFGLGLYNGGSTHPHGQYSVQQQPGILFDWKPVAVDPAVQQAPAMAVTHETIQAEPAVSDDDGAPEVATTGHQPSAKMRKFNDVQQGLQADREAARNNPMQARIQAGMKVDGHPAGPTAAEEAQRNG